MLSHKLSQFWGAESAGCAALAGVTRREKPSCHLRLTSLSISSSSQPSDPRAGSLSRQCISRGSPAVLITAAERLSLSVPPLTLVPVCLPSLLNEAVKGNG